MSISSCRFLPALLATAAVALCAAAPIASGDAIVYADDPKGGGAPNVWLASPDASIKKQVTSNATKDLRYLGPSQADNGKIAVVYGTGSRGRAIMQVLNTQGKILKTGLVQMNYCGLACFPITTGARIDPGGDTIAYSYFAGGGGDIYTAITLANMPGVMDPPVQFPAYQSPSWLPTKAAGAAAPDVVVSDLTGMQLAKASWRKPYDGSVVWAFDPSQTDARFGAASMSRTGRILAYSMTESDGSEEIWIARLNGPFAPGVDSLSECRVTTTAGGVGQPSISPDGSRVAWRDDGGAKVATLVLPRTGDEQPCGGSTKLISRTAGSPVFSGARAPTRDSGGGGKGLVVKAPGKATRAQVRKGLTFSTRCSSRCTVKGTMIAGGKKVAGATTTRRKKGTARLKLRARLDGTVSSVIVVISSAGRSATLTIPISG